MHFLVEGFVFCLNSLYEKCIVQSVNCNGQSACLHLVTQFSITSGNIQGKIFESFVILLSVRRKLHKF
jgi:hypothetical protein